MIDIMTKKQEDDIVKIVNSNRNWSIGLFVTIALFVIGFMLENSEFKGRINERMNSIDGNIKEIKQTLNNKSDEKKSISIETALKETNENIKNVEFFLSAKFGYKPIQRSLNKI